MKHLVIIFFYNHFILFLGVMPDSELEQMLLNIFGRRGIPLRKYWRMMYWMPKFKNLSPWPLPESLPDNTLELANLAIQRITSVDPDTKIDVWQVTFLTLIYFYCITYCLRLIIYLITIEYYILEHSVSSNILCQTEEIEASIDKTWIVCAQSRIQKVLLAEQPPDIPLVIKGPFNIYLRDQVVTYFLLLGKTRPEYEDNTDTDGIFSLLSLFFDNKSNF